MFNVLSYLDATDLKKLKCSHKFLSTLSDEELNKWWFYSSQQRTPNRKLLGEDGIKDDYAPVIRKVLKNSEKQNDSDKKINTPNVFLEAYETMVQKNKELSIEERKEVEVFIALFPDKIFKRDSLRASLFHGFYDKITNDPNNLKKFLELLPDPDRFEAILEKDHYERTILHRGYSSNNYFSLFFSLLPEGKRLQACKEKNSQGQTVLHSEHSVKDLTTLLNLYPKHERLSAIKEKDSLGNSLLHHAYYRAEALDLLLQYYPEKERVNAIEEENKFGESTVYRAKDERESIQKLLSYYRPEERLKALSKENEHGRSILSPNYRGLFNLASYIHMLPETERLDFAKKEACNLVKIYEEIDFESLDAIIESIPENERLEFIKHKRSGSSYQHDEFVQVYQKYVSPEKQETLLNKLPTHHCLELLSFTLLFRGEQFIDRLTHSPQILERVFNRLTLEERLQALFIKDRSGCCFIYRLTSEPQLLQALLAPLSPSNKLKVINDTDNGLTLSYSKYHPESFVYLLQLYPEHERLNVIKNKDKNGNSILSSILEGIPQTLKNLFTILPEGDVQNLVKEKDNNNTTHLNNHHTCPKSVDVLLRRCPENERLNAIKEKDQSGISVLSRAMGNSELLEILQKYFSVEELSTEILEKNQNGQSLLNTKWICKTTIDPLLTIFPQGERLNLLNEKIWNSETLLEYFVNHHQDLVNVLSYLTDDDKIKLIGGMIKNSCPLADETDDLISLFNSINDEVKKEALIKDYIKHYPDNFNLLTDDLQERYWIYHQMFNTLNYLNSDLFLISTGISALAAMAISASTGLAAASSVSLGVAVGAASHEGLKFFSNSKDGLCFQTAQSFISLSR